MDAQVKQALAKWPNVPHCYGWLALDARGNWRMRNEEAQKNNHAGERIKQSALNAFINRNYTHDERGCWYFQNGPQRVYVELEAAPYIARIAADGALQLHTDEPFRQPDTAWLSDCGRLWLQDEGRIALLNDRDLQACLGLLSIDGQALTDDGLDGWLRSGGTKGELRLQWNERMIRIRHLDESEAPRQFGFTLSPSSAPHR